MEKTKWLINWRIIWLIAYIIGLIIVILITNSLIAIIIYWFIMCLIDYSYNKWYKKNEIKYRK